ncbi:MAG: hypothetical protein ACKPKO_39175, partial [Candidatus Fonsibacter sp.]
PLLWARSVLLPQTRMVIALMLTVLITPVVFPYTMNWALAASAVLIASAVTSQQAELPVTFLGFNVRIQLFTMSGHIQLNESTCFSICVLSASFFLTTNLSLLHICACSYVVNT